MGNAIHTPFDFSEPVKAGRRRFWKQVLPVTSIHYNGQKIDFDPKFHMDLADSFKKEAFDQVPVVFADSENRHNMDPRNFGGEVLDMQYRGPGKDGGTWALVEADKDTAKVLSKNPRLGVSARIRQAVEKADGRKFGRAIEHVLLTMNPRVTGMSPWQAVDLSDADIEVVDLTAETYTEEGAVMARKQTKTTSTGQIDLSNLSDEDFQRLLDLAVEEGIVEGEPDDEDLEDEEVDETTDSGKVKKTRKKVTEEESEEPVEDANVDADLSDADKVIRRDEVSQFQQMRLDLAEERWGRERGAYVAAGVPPFLVDLAEPLLALPDAVTIDLSDDESVNASKIVRDMLNGVKGVIDMSGEFGHQVDLSVTEEQKSNADALLDAWDKTYG